MKRYYIFLLVLCFVGIGLISHAQSTGIDKQKVKEDLEEILSDISTRYVYLS